MHRLGLAGKRPKEKYHSYRGEVVKVADNIINRDFSTDRPLQKWTTDVTQFTLSWGKCYLSPILDMNTNEVISYDLSLSPNMEQIKDMPRKAFERFPDVEGLIMHSDQGWQYQHATYRSELQKHKIIQSMSRKGNCYDNCITPILGYFDFHGFGCKLILDFHDFCSFLRWKRSKEQKSKKPPKQSKWFCHCFTSAVRSLVT